MANPHRSGQRANSDCSSSWTWCSVFMALNAIPLTFHPGAAGGCRAGYGVSTTCFDYNVRAGPADDVRNCQSRVIVGNMQPSEKGIGMPKFVISPHFRLHEWVAEEK